MGAAMRRIVSAPVPVAQSNGTRPMNAAATVIVLGRMRFTADQLTQQLAKSSVNVATLKARIKADLVWPQLVRGRYQASLQVGEKDLLTALETKSDEGAGYDYALRPILFLVPSGSPETFVEGRKREAESLRARFQGCDEGLNFARALKDVAIREQVVRRVEIPSSLCGTATERNPERVFTANGEIRPQIPIDPGERVLDLQCRVIRYEKRIARFVGRI